MDVERGLLLAADVRSRNGVGANILYIDERVNGRSEELTGFCALDILSTIARHGHRITLVTSLHDDNDTVIKAIDNLGIEYYNRDFSTLVSARAGFYNAVIVSRPALLDKFRDQLRFIKLECPFILYFDADAMPYTGGAIPMKLITVDGIHFSGEHSTESDLAICRTTQNLVQLLSYIHTFLYLLDKKLYYSLYLFLREADHGFHPVQNLKLSQMRS